MAKKGIVLSNNDSRVTFSNTGSLSVDDVTNNISASYISASSLSISGLAVGSQKILSSSGGLLSTFNNGTINGGAIAFDGANWVASDLEPSSYIGTAGGDLSGSYDDDIKVINISNVSAGLLPVNYGGTGQSLSQGTNYIVKVSSSSEQTPVFSTISATSGSVLTCVDNTFVGKKPAYEPEVRFYDTPGVYTWEKPVGHMFVRAIMQGAGGGGVGGWKSSDNSTYSGGGGGASGGFSDIILDISSISSASLSVGAGGAGGASSDNGWGPTAGSGGSSTITLSSGTSYSAGGGGAGIRAGAADSTAGVGLTKNGIAGRGPDSSTSPTSSDMPSGGGRGTGTNNGAATAGGTILYNTLNKNLNYSLDYYGNSIIITNASGASGASTNSIPAKPGYGAGGGGGYSTSTARTNGGPGGDGYILIISW